MYLRGLVPPMATPLTPDEELDAPALARLVDFLIEGGSHAIFAAGSTGEFWSLGDDVRAELVGQTVERAAGRVPVLAGVGEAATARASERVREACAAGVDAVVALAPYYLRFSQEEIVGHFLRLRDASDVPLVVYENPHTTHHSIGIDEVMRLADEERIDGLKDSSGDWERFARLTELIAPREDFFILQGHTPYAGRSILAGADGYVPGVGNVDPELCRRLYDAAAAGDRDATTEIQADLDALRGIFGPGRAYPGLKYAMQLLGLCGPTASAPQAPLAPHEKDHVRAVLVRSGLL